MLDAFLEIVEKTIILIRQAEKMDIVSSEKRAAVVKGMQELMKKAPSIPAKLKGEKFLGELVDLMVAIGNLSKKPEAVMSVIKEGFELISAYFRKEGE